MLVGGMAVIVAVVVMVATARRVVRVSGMIVVAVAVARAIVVIIVVAIAVVVCVVLGLLLPRLVDRGALGYAGVVRLPHYVGVCRTAEYPLQCIAARTRFVRKKKKNERKVVYRRERPEEDTLTESGRFSHHCPTSTTR